MKLNYRERLYYLTKKKLKLYNQYYLMPKIKGEVGPHTT